jgi:hypothetical protein
LKLKSERRVIKKREVKKRCSGLFVREKGKVNKTRNNEKPTDRLSGQEKQQEREGKKVPTS